jgi:hypothetical protein
MAAVKTLDSLVGQKRKRAGAGGSGNQPHPFLRDEPRHRPLPKRRGKSIRIPKALVDIDWLAQNPMYDLPAFVTDESVEEAEEANKEIDSHEIDDGMDGEDPNGKSDSSGTFSLIEWIQVITHSLF